MAYAGSGGKTYSTKEAAVRSGGTGEKTTSEKYIAPPQFSSTGEVTQRIGVSSSGRVQTREILSTSGWRPSTESWGGQGAMPEAAPVTQPVIQKQQPSQQLQATTRSVSPSTQSVNMPNVMGAAPSQLSETTQQVRNRPPQSMVRTSWESFKSGVFGLQDKYGMPNTQGYSSGFPVLGYTAGVVTGIALTGGKLPNVLGIPKKGVDLLRATKVVQTIEATGRIGRGVVAVAGYSGASYITGKVGGKVVDVLRPQTTGLISEEKRKQIFGEARASEMVSGFKSQPNTKVRIGNTLYKIPATGLAKQYVYGSAGALVPALSPSKDTYFSSVESQLSGEGLNKQQVAQEMNVFAQTRRGKGAVQTIQLLQAEAFANVAGAREVRLAKKAGLFNTLGQAFKAKIVPGAVEGTISVGAILQGTESDLPTFIPRFNKYIPDVTITSTKTIEGKPTITKSIEGDKIINTITTPMTTTTTTKTIPGQRAGFVPSKALLVTGGAGIGILTAGSYGMGEMYFGKSKVLSKLWGGVGYGSDIPEYPGDVVTPILAPSTSGTIRVRGATVDVMSGVYSNTRTKADTKTRTTTSTKVKDVTSTNIFTQNKDITKVTGITNNKVFSNVIVPSSRGSSRKSISLNRGSPSTNINFNTQQDITTTKNDIIGINKITSTDIITKSRNNIQTDVLTRTDVMSDVLTRTDVNVNVMTPKIPFLIPGGGGSGKGWNFGGGNRRIGSKYTPSLVASVYNIVGKQPGISTGFGIRPILGKANKKGNKMMKYVGA